MSESCLILCDPHGAHQAPLSMGFSRQECWSGLPFPPPGDLPDPGREPRSPTLQDSLPSEPVLVIAFKNQSNRLQQEWLFRSYQTQSLTRIEGRQFSREGRNWYWIMLTAWGMNHCWDHLIQSLLSQRKLEDKGNSLSGLGEAQSYIKSRYS